MSTKATPGSQGQNNKKGKPRNRGAKGKQQMVQVKKPQTLKK